MDAKLKAVYTPVGGEKLDKPSLRRIGTGFVNRDASLDIVLEALPVSGRLHVRDLEPRDEGASAKEGA